MSWEEEGGRDTGSREDRSGGRGGHLRVLVESLGSPGFLGHRSGGWTISGGDTQDVRGRRGGSRRGSEGEDGRLEVLDGVGIGTRVGNRMGENG